MGSNYGADATASPACTCQPDKLLKPNEHLSEYAKTLLDVDPAGPALRIRNHGRDAKVPQQAHGFYTLSAAPIDR